MTKHIDQLYANAIDRHAKLRQMRLHLLACGAIDDDSSNKLFLVQSKIQENESLLIEIEKHMQKIRNNLLDK